MNSSDQPLVSNQLPISIEFPTETGNLVETISDIYKRIANSVNTKEGGLYVPQEVATFQQYFTSGNPQRFRPVYRKVIDCGALPNATTKDIAHGISFTSDFSVTRIYGGSTEPTGGFQYIPLPFSSPLSVSNNIALYATGTNIRIITSINYSNFTRTTVVIEYTKNL